MDRHIRILGYLFIIWGGIILASMMIIPFLPGVIPRTPEVGFTIFSAFFAGLVALFYTVAGWSLLTRQPYARTIAIVASVLAIFNFPLGTALGIYGLWVAFSQAGREAFGTYSGPGHPVP